MPLALLVASRSRSVDEAIRTAIGLGGDTDTIASLAAQVVGATGAALPPRIAAAVGAIAGRDVIVEAFVATVGSRSRG